MDAETKRMKAEIKLLTAKVAALVGSLDTPQVARWKRMHEGVCHSMKIDPITGESLDGRIDCDQAAENADLSS